MVTPTCVKIHGLPLPLDTRQAEIGHFHLAGAGEHDVLRLDVAVNDFLLSRLVQGRGNLPHDAHGGGRIQRSFPLDQLFQVLALDVLLDHEVDSVQAAHLVDLDDIRVDQGSRCLGFVQESSHVRGVGGEVILQDFERDLASQRFLLGQIDVRHPAAAQTAQQVIVSEAAAGEVGFPNRGRGGSGVSHEFRFKSRERPRCRSTRQRACTPVRTAVPGRFDSRMTAHRVHFRWRRP